MFARVPLGRVRENPFQMRTEYGDVGEIAASLRKLKDSRPETSGLIQVPPGRVVLDGKVLDIREYGGVLACLGDEPEAVVQLAAGHRRFRAFQDLYGNGGDGDFATFPVEIQVIEDAAMADIAWQENARRKDLSPVEEARAIRRAMDEFGYSLGDVAERWGISKSAASNKVRLLELPEKVQNLVQAGHLGERHARELLPLVQVGQSLKSAEAMARRAAQEEWPASRVANEVKWKLDKLTRQIHPEMMEWEDWGGIPLPEKCNLVCKGCPREARGKCSRPKFYNEKMAIWARRLLALAAEKTELPVLSSDEAITLDAPTLRHAQECECKSLGLVYREWAYQGVQVDGALPGVYYACKKGWQCDCAKAQRQAEIEADPQRAEYQAWDERQKERAEEIIEGTLLHMEAGFRAALNWMPKDDYLRLFVALVKGGGRDDMKVSADVDSVAKALALLACGTNSLGIVGDFSRVGRAMVHRARIYHLAGFVSAIDEVEGYLQVLRDVMKGAELQGRERLARWQYSSSLERAHEILDALPGHEELRQELARLEAQVEAFSQENERGD